MSIKIAIFGKGGRLGSAISRQIADPFVLSPDDPDLYIDASLPPGVPAHLNLALSKKKPIVIGVTALPETTHALMEKAAQTIPVFYSPNFSLGVAVLKKIAELIAIAFHPNADIDLIETHHTQKKDAPSGTALSLEKILQTKGKKATLHSIRSGEIVGIHELIFNTAEEKLSITHTAHSRDAFARGALLAASFLLKQSPGLYGMDEFLS